MKRTALTVLLVLIGLAVVAAYLTLFTVYQTQQALVLEFGKPKRLITEPGLNYKIPFIQNVQFFDKRLLDLDSAPQEVIAADQKRLVVDAFARWRITNPLLFYQSVNNETGARTQLSAFLEAALRRVLGAASFEAVVRDDRNDLASRWSMCASNARICRKPTALPFTGACKPSGNVRPPKSAPKVRRRRAASVPMPTARSRW